MPKWKYCKKKTNRDCVHRGCTPLPSSLQLDGVFLFYSQKLGLEKGLENMFLALCKKRVSSLLGLKKICTLKPQSSRTSWLLHEKSWSSRSKEKCSQKVPPPFRPFLYIYIYIYIWISLHILFFFIFSSSSFIWYHELAFFRHSQLHFPIYLQFHQKIIIFYQSPEKNTRTPKLTKNIRN
jgi:hypothetical protein